MRLPWPSWPGWTWLAHTGEIVAFTSAATLYASWQQAPRHALSAIDWAGAASQCGYEALGVVLLAVASLKVGNGTASFLKSVVSKGKAERDVANAIGRAIESPAQVRGCFTLDEGE